MEKNCKCDCLRMLTRKEQYQYFRKHVSEYIEEIRAAETVGNIINGINQLETLMNNARLNSQLHEVRGYVEDILGTIRAIKMRDCTRKELLQLLEVAVEQCDEILAEETEKENVNRFRCFLQYCADHADEIAAVIDLGKILG